MILVKAETDRIISRLVRSGIPVTKASLMVGLSRTQGYNLLKKKAQKGPKARYVSVKKLDLAEKLVLQGVPLDVVAAATGLSGYQIIGYLSELGESHENYLKETGSL